MTSNMFAQAETAGPAGFSVINRSKNDIEFQIFQPPTSKYSSLVTYFRAPDAIAALLGRLYYRQELLADCRSSSDDFDLLSPSSNDAELVLAIYRCFGVKGLERLEGDFALVLWDSQNRCLVAARDPMGGYPLFWTETAEIFMLSTSMYPLLKLLPHRSLNLTYLADYFLVTGSQSELSSEQCVYQGIHRVLPGSLLSIKTTERRVSHYVYWKWLDNLIDPGTDHLVKVSEQYIEKLTQAIRERLYGLTASHLSGGMDSTTVALLARACIASEGRQAPLHTITLVYERLPSLARETPFIDSVLYQQQDIVAHRIVADDLLDFNAFTDPPFHEEPYPGLWRLSMDRATIDAAIQLGAATLLTGVGADEVLDTQPFYLTDLLRRGHIWTAWTEACQWARANQWSPWQVFYPFGLANLFPAWTRLGSGRLLHRRGSLSTENAWDIPPWIRSDFACQYELRRRAMENIYRTYAFCRPTALSVALSSIVSRAGNTLSWSLAMHQGMAITHPFLDTRVLCLGLGIQARMKPQPGRLKPIIAEAMRGVLPNIIRNRRSKGHFNEVFYLGLSRNLPILEAIIQQTPCDDLEIVDKNLLIQHLYKAALGGTGARPLQHLNTMLAFLKWFSLQQEWRPIQCNGLKISDR